MNYGDDESIEERSFKISGNDEDGLYEALGEPLEPGADEGVSFGKGEEAEEGEEKFADKENY